MQRKFLCFVFSVFILCSSAACNSTPANTGTITSATQTDRQVLQPTPSPTVETQQHQAILGGSLEDFQARYGAFTLDASYTYYHGDSHGSDKYIDLLRSKTSGYVLSVGIDNIPAEDIDHACDQFIPSDATFIKKIKAGSFEYYSATIAQRFPDSNRDYALPPDKVGSFGLASFTYDANHAIGRCFLQIG